MFSTAKMEHYYITHRCNRGLPEVGLEDGHPRLVIRQWDVDELVKSARTQDGRVNDVRPGGGANDENILLAAHTIHLS